MDPAPSWALYLAATFAASVLVYCLWTGEVGLRGGGVVKRKGNPPLYWVLMLVLAYMVFYLIKHALARLPT